MVSLIYLIPLKMFRFSIRFKNVLTFYLIQNLFFNLVLNYSESEKELKYRKFVSIHKL